MATFDKIPSGYWRAQVRRKGQRVSRTFRLKSEAEAWAIETERAIQTGKNPDAIQIDDKTSFGTLVDLHITDLADVGKPLLRSKAMCLEKLRRELGSRASSKPDARTLDQFWQAAGP